MKATIVIPNINGKGWLKDSIESVYAQTEQDFELIIVDNGSTDESLEQARSYCGRPNFTLIENGTNTGFSHAVNQGIARAKGEYVVMFNNDAFAEPEWLAELIRTAETDPKIFAVQSLMLRHFERELADDAGDYVTWMGFACKTGDGRRASRYTKQKRIFSACGGAALYRKSILEEIGTFDENFFAYFEDVDLSWRANNAGLQVCPLPHRKMLPHLRCQHRRGEVQRLQEPAERPEQHPAPPQERAAAHAHPELSPAGAGLSAQVLQVPQAGLWRSLGQGNARSLRSAQRGAARQASLPPEGPAQLYPHGAVDGLEHGALPVVSSGRGQV